MSSVRAAGTALLVLLFLVVAPVACKQDPVMAQEVKGVQAPNCPYSFAQLEQTIEEHNGEILRVVRLPAEQYDTLVFYSRPSDRVIFFSLVKLGCVVSAPIPLGNAGTPA